MENQESPTGTIAVDALAKRMHLEAQGYTPEKAQQIVRQEEEEAFVQQAKKLRVEYVDLSNMKLDQDIGRIVPEAMAKRYNIICIGKVEKRLTVAMADPNDIFALDDVRLRTNFDVTPV